MTDKQSLRRALQSQTGTQKVLAPRIQHHAAALEQVSTAALWTDSEAIARSLRNAQSLYNLDAVTLGDGHNIAVATRQACFPKLSALEALAEDAPISEPPSPEAVMTTPVVTMYLEACHRVQTVLANRAATAIVVPDEETLRSQLAIHDQPGWTRDLLIHTIRTFGPLEPDLFMFVGMGSQLDPRLRATASHFGAVIAHVSTAHTDDGILCLSTEVLRGADPNTYDTPESPWLITTLDEVESDADPTTLGESLSRSRRQNG